ncbi:MAG: gephyrin-like molybdotransferase Glp [Granulosicoccaceae bacterium]
MTADANDCQSDYDPNSLSLEQARERILADINNISREETLALEHCMQRVLAQDIDAPRDVPPYRNSAMDGFACRAQDLPHTGSIELQVVGESLAGHAYTQPLEQGQAISITTGAVLPDNADVVVMQERTHSSETGVSFNVRDAQNKSFVRERGSDTRQGDNVMRRGNRLGAAQIAVLASLGLSQLAVFTKPKVAVLSTGDELVEGGCTPAVDQIFDSNRPALKALLALAKVEIIDMGICPDNPHIIRETLLSAAEQADVIISSGGVSVGQADHLRTVLEEIGELSFWKIAVKPGRPLTYGHINQSHYFGLPGNPVSTLVTFQQLVEPALNKLSGEQQTRTAIQLKAICKSELVKQPGRQEFQRGVLSQEGSGEMHVVATGAQDSHILSSVSRANCLIDLPAASAGAKIGDSVQVHLL